MPTVVIHSENPTGVQKIRVSLPSAEAVPFGRLNEKGTFTSRLKQLLSKPLRSEELTEVTKLLRLMCETAGKPQTRRIP